LEGHENGYQVILLLNVRHVGAKNEKDRVASPGLLQPLAILEEVLIYIYMDFIDELPPGTKLGFVVWWDGTKILTERK
jgi:hypothetical protein